MQAASFDAETAGDTQVGINGVFVIRVFDEFSFQGIGWAHLVIDAGIHRARFGMEIPAAWFAISADAKAMEAFDGGLFQNAFGGAFAALDALVGVDLPGSFAAGVAGDKGTQGAADAQQGGGADSAGKHVAA